HIILHQYYGRSEGPKAQAPSLSEVKQKDDLRGILQKEAFSSGRLGGAVVRPLRKGPLAGPKVELAGPKQDTITPEIRPDLNDLDPETEWQWLDWIR
uniref:Uncharacterized protein n=1 Tax=Romanomermis culicivorax TaxID=13658 RepID=A0A915L4L7_ROMCU